MAEESERISAARSSDSLEAFNAHDIGAVMSFFVEDCVLEMPRVPSHGVADGGTRPVRRVSRADSPGFRASTTARIETGALAIAAARNGS